MYVGSSGLFKVCWSKPEKFEEVVRTKRDGTWRSGTVDCGVLKRDVELKVTFGGDWAKHYKDADWPRGKGMLLRIWL